MHEHWIHSDDEDGQRTVLRVRGRPVEWNQDEILVKWLRQVKHDHSERQAAMAHLLADQQYSRLYWNLRQLGEATLMDALDLLNHRYGKRHIQDPRKPLPYSKKAILEAAALSARVGYAPAYPLFRQALPEEVLYRARPLEMPTPYAWIHVQPGNPPMLLVEASALVPEELAVFEGAATLGFYLKHAQELRTVVEDVTLYVPEPQIDKFLTPLLHAFAQGLFNLDGCPLGAHVSFRYHCWCSRVVAHFNEAPPLHPRPTDALPPRAVPVQETGQQEALLKQALHDAANVSPFVARGMTPPGGPSHHTPTPHPIDRNPDPADIETLDTMRLHRGDLPSSLTSSPFDVPDETEQHHPRERSSGS